LKTFSILVADDHPVVREGLVAAGFPPQPAIPASTTSNAASHRIPLPCPPTLGRVDKSVSWNLI